MSHNRRSKLRKVAAQGSQLMPEMDEFIDRKIEKQNYMSQEEGPDRNGSRLSTFGHNKMRN